MTDKSKQRAKEYARRHNIPHQGAVNQIRGPLRDVLNASEQQVEGKLKGVAADNGALVYSKVRFADVAQIEGSGLSDREYRFALQSHLDFTVTDENRKPLFAIEYDGQGHSTANDDLKNALCKRFELPLARINHHHLNLVARELDTITWLLEVVFVARAMEEAQANGTFPCDEPIDPFNIMSWERNSQKFPLSFTMALHARLHRLFDAKRLPSGHAFHVAFGNGTGGVTGVAVLRVGEDKFLATRESIYLDGLGVGPGETSMELAMARLGLLLTRHLKGEAVAEPARTVYERLKALTGRGAFHGGGCSSDPNDFSFAHANGETRILPANSMRQ